jgi:hypothetical protein
MNPEFVRNLWLEATPFRLALIAGVLLLVFAALSVSPFGGGSAYVAQLIYWFFTVLWGTRSAALSVVGEIRERTWDSQKLSSIGPVEMVWGKLLGATIHTWFGGFLCLPAVLWPIMRTQGAGPGLAQGATMLLLALLAQAVALLSSLVLVRRNTGNWRLDTFLCQVAGIAAAYSFHSLWRSFEILMGSETLDWWDLTFGSVQFHLVSLVLFTAWALVGCWRAMRTELRLVNGPLVWLAWLLFLFFYQAGFASMLPAGLRAMEPQGVVLRLMLGGLALIGSAYSMVFLEPKDPVRLRWLGEQLRAGRWWRAFAGLDAWMLSYGATLIVGAGLALLVATDHQTGMPGLALAVLAMLGFLTRDVAVFVLFGRISGGKGDFAALAVLAALYLLVPMILHGIGAAALTALFVPLPGSLLSPIAAWAQGIGVTLWARRCIVNSSRLGKT